MSTATPEDRSPLEQIFDAQDRGRQPGHWRRVTVRVLVRLTVVLALLVGAAWGATALVRVEPPLTLYRLLTTPPSQQGSLFAARTVAADPGAAPLPATPGLALPSEVPWADESGKPTRISVADFRTRTHTRALVVLREGRLVQEWYAPGVSAADRLSSWSVAKSVVSLLVGQAIDEGLLSENDRMVDLLEDFRGGRGDYDDITVGQLLDMTAAIDIPESYNEKWPFTGTARLFISTDLERYLRSHRAVTDVPGSRYDYRSVETQMLALILSRVTGTSLADLASEKLWQPMGAQDDATWNLDREDGTEKGFCCLNATARDFARLGQLVLDGGVVGTGADARQVVPAAWIRRISTPTQRTDDGWGYGAQWWHISRGPATAGSTQADLPDLTALGIHGQYIHVDPTTRTVIVKLSDHGTEQDEQLTVDALRALAAGIA